VFVGELMMVGSANRGVVCADYCHLRFHNLEVLPRLSTIQGYHGQEECW